MLPFSPEFSVFQFAIQKYKAYKIQNYNFACYFHKCASWSFTMMEELRLQLFENRVLRRRLGLGGTKKQEAGDNSVMKSFMICIPHQTLSE
jgi:hypothetical protein